MLRTKRDVYRLFSEAPKESPMLLLTKPSGKSEPWLENLSHTMHFLWAWLAGGFGVLLVCSVSFLIENWTREGFTKSVSVFSYGALLSLAFASMGGLVGFLFGIPRQLQQTATNAGNADDSKVDQREEPRPLATNLEQVSDWLTKIFFGAGLTQLVKLPSQLKLLGKC